jgi:hypothetical protein
LLPSNGMPGLAYSPFERPLEELTGDDIQSLIDRQIPEGPFVEYKLTFDKTQTPRSTSAFANSYGGGTLILGVKEESRLPVDKPGIAKSKGLDEQIAQNVNSNIHPRPAFAMQVVELAAGTVCVVIEVPEGGQPPYIFTPKGQVLRRTQVGSEPIKDRTELDRLFLRGRRGQQWAQRRVAELLEPVNFARKQVAVWTVPAVEDGLGVNALIFKPSFFEFLEAVMPRPTEGVLFTPMLHGTSASEASISEDDPWADSRLGVETSGVISTLWIQKEKDEEKTVPCSTAASLMRKALPVHSRILKEKLKHPVDVVVVFGGVVSGQTLTVVEGPVSVDDLAEQSFLDHLDRQMQ